MMALPGRASLALRLVSLFSAGSAIIMALVGYTLYHALGMQLDERDTAEINGKTEVVQHQLAAIPRADALAEHVGKLREITVGHPHLSIGLRSGSIWLLPPQPVVRRAIQGAALPPEGRIVTLEESGTRWWVRRITHHWATPQPASLDAFVAVEVTESQRILHSHRLVALLVVVLGTLFSGLLAYFVARRGLAPLHQLAAQAELLTAEQLGAPLDVERAPGEVRGVVESLNRMLARLHESFRSLEQFSADIAHELRTPLNNLMLQTQVTLSRPRDADSYHEALLSNLEELERMQRMVLDMLFLARADRGMLTLQCQALDLRAEADSLAEFFELAASERHQTITVTGAATVWGDRLMVRRALTNLLSNAVRYAPLEAAISITLEASASVASVTVSNPGPPIPPNELQHLVTRFARGDDARSRDTDGVGLGLAIVDSIIRLHQGEMTISSASGQIEVCLRFPAYAA